MQVLAHFRGHLENAEWPLAVLFGIVLQHLLLVLDSLLLLHELDGLVEFRVSDKDVEVYFVLEFFVCFALSLVWTLLVCWRLIFLSVLILLVFGTASASFGTLIL